MTFTIISANYANEENTAAVITTKENGAVAISDIDTPEEWENLLSWGKENKIDDYVTPEIVEETPEEKLKDFISENPDVKDFLKSLVG
jgi:hypothetical protein